MATTYELPPKITTSLAGSFARQTIEQRKPQIIQNIIDRGGYPGRVNKRLVDLKDEIASGRIRMLTENMPDVSYWNRPLEEHFKGKTWFEVDWLFAEAFFYRRVIEATEYFKEGALREKDPFRHDKEASFDGEKGATAQMIKAVPFCSLSTGNALYKLIPLCLWGNLADLSNIDLTQRGHTELSDLGQENILVNHLDAVVNILSRSVGCIDWVTDNSGHELAFDLMTIYYLLKSGRAGKVRMHLKQQPYFVSDATIKDVYLTFSKMLKSRNQELTAISEDLMLNIERHKLLLYDEPLWTSWKTFVELGYVWHSFPHSDLWVFKGDVNYRKLLDDRMWPFTANMEEITSYLPFTFVALRTLKAELMVDLDFGQAELISAKDPSNPNSWLISGKYGLIRFVDRIPKRFGAPIYEPAPVEPEPAKKS